MLGSILSGYMCFFFFSSLTNSFRVSVISSTFDGQESRDSRV